MKAANARLATLLNAMDTLERGSTIRALDDLHGFWKSRMVDWIHDDDVLHAYNSLRQHADCFARGEDVMDKIRAAVDRLLELLRSAIRKAATRHRIATAQVKLCFDST
jgi:hypothetical protein